MKPFALQPNIAAPNYPAGVCCLGIPDAWNAANLMSVEAPDAKTHQEKTPTCRRPVIFWGLCFLAYPQGRFAHGYLSPFFFFFAEKHAKADMQLGSGGVARFHGGDCYIG